MRGKFKLLWAAGIIMMLVGLLWCLLWLRPFVRRAHQLRAYVDMQMICSRIDNMARERGEDLRARDVLDAVRSVYGGIDVWGNEYLILYERSSGNHSRYLLVSRGSDGQLDIPHIEDYFDMEETAIHGQYEKDIVFVDGRAMTRAGK